jgi:IS5 family transposase
LPLVISQTERRVIKGEKVPSHEKIVSIFEDHTDIIIKGKRDVEYGHKVFLTAGKSGLVTNCQLVQGNPADSDFFLDLLNQHKKIYGKVPRQTSADGGFASEDNVYEAKEMGVKDVCFSKHVGLEIKEMVKSPWVFQKLRKFRAGIEGVISSLKRGFGLSKALWKGVSGFTSYVHSSIVAYNLTLLARLQL